MAIVAGARYWITRPDEAEIAFIVADAYQKQGVGTAMLNHLCSIARQAGLKRLYALAIPDNEGAPRLLNKLGFPCDIRRDPAATDDAHCSSLKNWACFEVTDGAEQKLVVSLFRG
jgi:RimJ/RimL family protein N-acetyltransferase